MPTESSQRSDSLERSPRGRRRSRRDSTLCRRQLAPSCPSPAANCCSCRLQHPRVSASKSPPLPPTTQRGGCHGFRPSTSLSTRLLLPPECCWTAPRSPPCPPPRSPLSPAPPPRPPPALSAVAASSLAAPEASRLLVFGSGPQAWGHVHALACVRPLTDITIVGRSSASAGVSEVVEKLRHEGFAARPGAPEDVADADIIVCATTARTPLFAE